MLGSGSPYASQGIGNGHIGNPSWCIPWLGVKCHMGDMARNTPSPKLTGSWGQSSVCSLPAT